MVRTAHLTTATQNRFYPSTFHHQGHLTQTVRNAITVAFKVVFEFAVDLQPALALPFEQVRKWKKKCSLSEPQASFGHFPFFDLLKREPEGQRLCGRLLLLTFLGEARKVSSRRSTTGRQSRQTTSVI
ncbi:hypothetical protein [Undibacterium sp. RuTC16W]|uniref:hypothetical protein n=1 Tax=Undibacterium sp. RuTC16W TaxID=3413048 RepID=UPI003BF447E2